MCRHVMVTRRGRPCTTEGQQRKEPQCRSPHPPPPALPTSHPALPTSHPALLTLQQLEHLTGAGVVCDANRSLGGTAAWCIGGTAAGAVWIGGHLTQRARQASKAPCAASAPSSERLGGTNTTRAG